MGKIKGHIKDPFEQIRWFARVIRISGRCRPAPHPRNNESSLNELDRILNKLSYFHFQYSASSSFRYFSALTLTTRLSRNLPLRAWMFMDIHWCSRMKCRQFHDFEICIFEPWDVADCTTMQKWCKVQVHILASSVTSSINLMFHRSIWYCTDNSSQDDSR